MIVLIALVAEMAIRRLAPVQPPEIGIGWGMAELHAAVAVLALPVIKIISHVGNFGWGFLHRHDPGGRTGLRRTRIAAGARRNMIEAARHLG